MARGKTALVAMVLVATASVATSEQPAAAAVGKWHPAHVSQGKTFPLLLPADGGWLNWRNTYGAPRMRLIDGTWQQVGVHQGIDIFAERGAPIVSITSGTVENVGWTFYSGYRVGVRGSDGAYYFYAHMLASFAPGIAPGARVTPGRILGYLGSSGYGPEGTAEEFPPHLHFGLQRSTWVDPDAMLKDLYLRAAGAARQHEDAARSARALERSLRGRMYSPMTLPTDVLLERTRAVRGNAQELADRSLSGG